MPSASRLRQRFDEDAYPLISLIDEANIEFLQRIKAPITANKEGYVVIDADLFPWITAKPKKKASPEPTNSLMASKTPSKPSYISLPVNY